MLKRKLVFLIVVIFISFLPDNIFAQQKKINNSSNQNSHANKSNKFSHNEADQALLYDIVVLGTVMQINYMPGSVKEMFHSEVIIKIDSVIKGNLSFMNIIIRLESGPVNDDSHGGDWIISSIEPRFKIGEQTVLFLNRVATDGYLNSPFVREKYRSFNGKKSSSELSDSTFWAGNNQVFTIKDGTVNYFNMPRNKNDFIQNIIKQK